MKKIAAFILFLSISLTLSAKTIFTTTAKQSKILLELPKNSQYYHVMITGKQSRFTEDVIHIYFKEEVNSFDYVKSVLEKTPAGSTYWQFVNQSIKLDKTGILYWNDYTATKKYKKGNCFFDERFYYSYDTESFLEKKYSPVENAGSAL